MLLLGEIMEKAMDVDYEPTREAIKGLRNDQAYVLPPRTSLAFLESLTMPHFEEVVISADLKCTECQKRIADMISRFNETESIVVNVSEKKVIITCKYIKGGPKKQIIARDRNLFMKIALIKRIFGSSSRT